MVLGQTWCFMYQRLLKVAKCKKVRQDFDSVRRLFHILLSLYEKPWPGDLILANVFSYDIHANVTYWMLCRQTYSFFSLILQLWEGWQAMTEWCEDVVNQLHHSLSFPNVDIRIHRRGSFCMRQIRALYHVESNQIIDKWYMLFPILAFSTLGKYIRVKHAMLSAAQPLIVGLFFSANLCGPTAGKSYSW